MYDTTIIKFQTKALRLPILAAYAAVIMFALPLYSFCVFLNVHQSYDFIFWVLLLFLSFPLSLTFVFIMIVFKEIINFKRFVLAKHFDKSKLKPEEFKTKVSLTGIVTVEIMTNGEQPDFRGKNENR